MTKYLISFLILGVFSFCSKKKLEAPTASYLKIDSVNTQPTASQGTKAHKITDIWVYINGKFTGVYPVGNLIPVVSQGQTTITLFAGIKNNGISQTRQTYTFLKGLIIDTLLEPQQSITLYPKFGYVPYANFHLVEDMEGYGAISGIAVYTSPSSDTIFTVLNKLTNSSANVFEGNKSLLLAMSDAKPYVQIETANSYILPNSGGRRTYLELNYQCNQPFDIGVIGGASDQRYAVTVNNSDGWNKIYVELSTAVATAPLYNQYKLYIAARKQTDTPRIYIDNLKLVSE